MLTMVALQQHGRLMMNVPSKELLPWHKCYLFGTSCSQFKRALVNQHSLQNMATITTVGYDRA